MKLQEALETATRGTPVYTQIFWCDACFDLKMEKSLEGSKGYTSSYDSLSLSVCGLGCDDEGWHLIDRFPIEAIDADWTT